MTARRLGLRNATGHDHRGDRARHGGVCRHHDPNRQAQRRRDRRDQHARTTPIATEPSAAPATIRQPIPPEGLTVAPDSARVDLATSHLLEPHPGLEPVVPRLAASVRADAGARRRQALPHRGHVAAVHPPDRMGGSARSRRSCRSTWRIRTVASKKSRTTSTHRPTTARSGTWARTCSISSTARSSPRREPGRPAGTAPPR